MNKTELENKTLIETNEELVYKIFKSSIDGYETYGSRSSKKLIQPHNIIKDNIGKKENRKIYCLGDNNKERTEFFEHDYSKKCDFSCYDENDNLKYIIETKFIFRNYLQNFNNYFEGELGRAHILSSKCPYFSFIFCLEDIPYYNNKKEITKMEKIKKNHFERYKYLEDIKNCNCSISVFSLPNGGLSYTVGKSYKEMINLIKEI